MSFQGFSGYCPGWARFLLGMYVVPGHRILTTQCFLNVSANSTNIVAYSGPHARTPPPPPSARSQVGMLCPQIVQCGHKGMVSMEMEAGIRELKSKLSAYMRRVKAGETVVITERGKPIGRIVPVSASSVRWELVGKTSGRRCAPDKAEWAESHAWKTARCRWILARN